MLLACALGMLLPLSAASSKKTGIPVGPKISILLAKEVDSAVLEVKGKYRVRRKDSGEGISGGINGKRFVVHALQDGLRWGEEYPDVFQLELIPGSEETQFFVNGMQYVGNLSVYHVKNNKITLVNEVSIEEFLKSTLPLKHDIPHSPEALSALIIAARTEAYARTQSGSRRCPWHISAEEAGYFGRGVTQQKYGIEKAVDSTRFMVLKSVKEQLSPKVLSLDPMKVEELAVRGLDAGRIFENLYPHLRMGVTIDPKEMITR